MKRFICILLIAAISLTLYITASSSDIWFVAVDDSIPVTLTGSAVPFYYNDQLYMPYSAFDSDVLNVFSIHDSSQNILAMYNIDHRLTFDINAGTVTDFNNSTDSIAALARNGSVYVPVNYVASYFGIGCSLLEGSGGYPIIRLTSGNEVYDNDKFIVQSKTLVEYRVSQYMSAPSPSPSIEVSPQITSSPIVTPPQNDTPSPQESGEPVEETTAYEPITVPDAALFFPGESFENICDSLLGESVVFTYSPDELSGSDDTVRNIICAGHHIAVELDLSDIGHALEAVSRFNDMLDSMTHSKTMLILTANASEESIAAMEQYGYRVWSGTVSAVGDFKITDYEGCISVYFPSPKANSVSYLVKFLRYYSGEIIDVTLTTEPF